MSDKLSSNAGFKWNEKALVDLLNLCIYFKCFVKSKEHNEYIALWKQLHRNLRNNREKTPKKPKQTNKTTMLKYINWFYTGVNKQLIQIDLLISNEITMIAGTVTCFFVSSVKN